MFGPGKGHNVKRFLDYFQNSREYELTFVYYTFREHYSYNIFNRINFFSALNIFKLVSSLVKNNDLIWIHNWCPWQIILIILIFNRNKSPINFDVWSESVPKSLYSGTYKSFLYRYIFDNVDFIQCHWYSTYRYFKTFSNVYIIPWGIENDYFIQRENSINSTYIFQFIHDLNASEYKFFVPKSVDKNNRHDIIVEAVKLLIKEGVSNFRVIFWLGNHVKPKILKNIKAEIDKYGLQGHITLADHPFVSIHELKRVWQEMDCLLQILEHDQLSTSMLEAMLLKKEIIASNIYSYKCLNEYENSAHVISEKMKNCISGYKSNSSILEKRNFFVNNTRQFDKNIVKMLETFCEN